MANIDGGFLLGVAAIVTALATLVQSMRNGRVAKQVRAQNQQIAISVNGRLDALLKHSKSQADEIVLLRKELKLAGKTSTTPGA